MVAIKGMPGRLPIAACSAIVGRLLRHCSATVGRLTNSHNIIREITPAPKLLTSLPLTFKVPSPSCWWYMLTRLMLLPATVPAQNCQYSVASLFRRYFYS